MDQTNLSLDKQLKTAEIDKLTAEADKAKAEKLKIDLESKELKRQHSKSIFGKKEFWPILIGTLVAWTAVGYYVVPLSEIHNNQITLENTKKSDTLYIKEKQLHLAYDTLHSKEAYLAVLLSIVNRQKEDNSKLIIARHKIDSSYSVLYRLYSHKRETTQSEIQKEIISFKAYLDDYKNKQKEEAKVIPTLPLSFGASALTGYSPDPSNLKLILGANSGLSGSQYADTTFRKWYSLGLSDNPNVPILSIRTLFNGTLIKNLTIHISAKPSSFGSLHLINDPYSILQPDKSYDVEYSPENGYGLNTFLSGNYIFEISGDTYKVGNIRASDGTSSDNNQISFLTVNAMNKLKIDLILEKK